MSPIYLDITELVANPFRTGIQRVEREIIRHWPGPGPLVPCRFDGDTKQFLLLSDAVLEILTSKSAKPMAEEKEMLGPHLTGKRPISERELVGSLFNPEVFFDWRRADAYRTLARDPSAEIAWLVYDFLPYLRPQDYPPGTGTACMHYILAMQSAARTSFISERTRSEFIQRVMRDPRKAGPAIPLGGDSPAMPLAKFNPLSKQFVYVGTIEPRKNVADILLAFEALWRDSVDVCLTVIGRIDSRSTRELPILERLESEPRFKYLGHVEDETVRQTLEAARATIFVSSVEGFGIPPYESLAAGIPVIASGNLPSLELLPPGGRITLDAVTPESISSAVLRLLEADTATQLWKEASQLKIPTWRDFARTLAAWLHGDSPSPIAH